MKITNMSSISFSIRFFFFLEKSVEIKIHEKSHRNKAESYRAESIKGIYILFSLSQPDAKRAACKKLSMTLYCFLSLLDCIDFDWYPDCEA